MLKHQHLIVRAEISSPPGKDQIEWLNSWYAQLIEAIGMKILIEPRTVYCDMPGNRGMTGVCAIETSSSALHVWDEDSPAVIQFDLYSCSCIDVRVVFDKLAVFKPIRIDYHFIDRDDMSDPKDPHRISVIDQGRLVW